MATVEGIGAPKVLFRREEVSQRREIVSLLFMRVKSFLGVRMRQKAG
jgi:hypothetical protein